MKNVICIMLLSQNQVNVHRPDKNGTPRMIATVKVIDNEPRITEVERKDDIYSFYLTMEDCNVIWDNWNALQEQRAELEERVFNRQFTEYRGDNSDGSVGVD